MAKLSQKNNILTPCRFIFRTLTWANRSWFKPLKHHMCTDVSIAIISIELAVLPSIAKYCQVLPSIASTASIAKYIHMSQSILLKTSLTRQTRQHRELFQRAAGEWSTIISLNCLSSHTLSICWKSQRWGISLLFPQRRSSLCVKSYPLQQISLLCSFIFLTGICHGTDKSKS